MYAQSHILVTAAAVMAIGCGGSAGRARPIPPPPDHHRPATLIVDTPLFYPGEYMSWRLSWRGIEGGTTRLLVGDPGTIDHVRAIVVRSETRSAGVLALFRHVRDDLITTIDLTTARPLQIEGHFEWGKPGGTIKASRVRVDFEPGSYAILYRRRNHGERRWTQRVPPSQPVYDTHAALGALRAWTAPPGTRAHFLALSGRHLYQIRIANAGSTSIATALGRQRAVRIEGVATRLTRSLMPNRRRKPRTFTVWISDDADRVPLRAEAHTEYGDVVIDIDSYERGRRATVAVQ